MCGSSLPRAIRTCPSATDTVSPAGMALTSSPFGPLTRTFPASALTSTPLGIATGIFPMRDTAVTPSNSPDVAENFAAQTLLAGDLVGHDALRGRDDGHAETPGHRRDGVGLRVDAAARPRDPLEPGHDGLALVVVLQTDAENRPSLLLGLAPGGDEPLLLEDLQDGLLQARGRDVHAV